MADTQQQPEQTLPGVTPEPTQPAPTIEQLTANIETQNKQMADLQKQSEADKTALAGFQEADKKQKEATTKREKEKQDALIVAGNWEKVAENRLKEVENITAKHAEQNEILTQNKVTSEELERSREAVKGMVANAFNNIDAKEHEVIKSMRSWDENDPIKQLDTINDYNKIKGVKGVTFPHNPGIPNSASRNGATYDILLNNAVKSVTDNASIPTVSNMFGEDPIQALAREQFKNYN